MFNFRKNNTARAEKVLSDMQKLKEETEECIAVALTEIKRLEQNYSYQLASTKYELSKDIIEQSNAPINKTVTVFSVVITLIALGGVSFTYIIGENLQAALETHMKQRVENWLSIENENSIAYKTLDSYRTRALLDSYMIQLARMKSKGDIRPLLGFKKGDEKRLLSIIESPISELSDFYDALKLLAVARGEWGDISQNNETTQRLRKIFHSSALDPQRQLDILEILQRDRALTPVASDFIKNKEQHPLFRHQSFTMLKDFPRNSAEGTLAYEYAVEILKTSENIGHSSDTAQYLAETDPFNPLLTTYLKSLDRQPLDSQIGLKLAVAGSWISRLPSPMMTFSAEDEARDRQLDREGIRERVAALLSDAINTGLNLDVSDSFTRPHLTMKYSHTSGTVEDIPFPLKHLFNDPKLLTKLFDLQSKNGAIRFAKFFNTSYAGEVITSIRLELPPKAIPGKATDGEVTVGQLQLSSDNTLVFTWKDETGERHESGLAVMPLTTNIQILFDERYLSYFSPFDSLMF